MSHLGLSRRALVLLGFSALAGCTGGAVSGPIGDGDDDAPAPEATDLEYRLGTGDQLRVIVFGETDLTGPFVVSSTGNVAFPLVGEVQATGLTMQEFSDALKDRLEAFIRQPIVSVEVTNYRPFFILGEVQRPGTYPYAARLTVQNAVATAGGFTYRANTRRVFIKHADTNEEREYTLTTNTPVLPGDTVRIAERRF